MAWSVQNHSESTHPEFVVTQTSHSRLLSLEIAEKLLAKRKPNDALPYLVKAMEDGTNLDAYVAMAFICPTLNDSVECLEAGIRKGMSV